MAGDVVGHEVVVVDQGPSTEAGTRKVHEDLGAERTEADRDDLGVLRRRATIQRCGEEARQMEGDIEDIEADLLASFGRVEGEKTTDLAVLENPDPELLADLANAEIVP